MRSVGRTWIFLAAVVALPFGIFGCKSPQVKADKPDPTAEGGGGTPQVQRGCIRGRITTEEGKGFSGVVISTNPATSPEITDNAGNFEICNRRVIKNAETGETSKESLLDGSYTLSATKDGYHARPFSFEYKGSPVKLENLTMVEKSKPLPSVVQTKEDEKKRSATGGKPPIGE